MDRKICPGKRKLILGRTVLQYHHHNDLGKQSILTLIFHINIINSNIILSVICLHTAKPPVFGPCKLLDFELEMVGPKKMS